MTRFAGFVALESVVFGVVPGCIWISPADHKVNHAQLTAADADADVDADADSDTDADVDSDADTDPLPCADDAYEPNETVLTATDVVPPQSVFSGVACPGNLDLYAVDAGPTEVVRVDVATEGVECAAMDLTFAIGEDPAVPFPGAVGYEGCPSLTAGWGAGTYVVSVDAGSAPEGTPYGLTVTVQPCNDGDGDGYLDSTCGGPDCRDDRPGQYPGAFDVQDGFDQDCDGGDDLTPQDCVIGTGFVFVDGTLGCGLLDHDPVWDVWELPVLGNVSLSVVVQNDLLGLADLLAVIVDPDGTSHYGLDPAGAQMDEEQACNAVPWNGARCPASCVLPTRDGVAQVFVAQHPGASCADGAYYSLIAYVNDVAVSAEQVLDDVPLDLPFP